jgi:DNA polymerase-3 subunit beta
MKFISLQENLKKGLNITGHITSKNINLPILNNILIKTTNSDIEFVSTNLEIGVTYKVRGKIEEEGEFTVDSKLINDYINILGFGEKVLIQSNEKEMKVESGNYKTKIKGEAATDFPLIPTIEKDEYYSINIIEFKKALSNVIFSVSNNENRLELTGVLFNINNNNLNLAATDSYRLAEKKIKINNDKEEENKNYIVPAKTIQEILRILNYFDYEDKKDEEIKIYLSDNQILFVYDSFSLISRLINGNYPDYKQIIPVENSTKTIIKKEELLRAVKAASLFSKNGINDILLQFNKNNLVVSSFSGATGESKIDIKCNIEGEKNEITVNYRYLIDGLNNIDGDNIIIEMSNNNSPCLLKKEGDDSYLYIIMPIRQ